MPFDFESFSLSVRPRPPPSFLPTSRFLAVTCPCRTMSTATYPIHCILNTKNVPDLRRHLFSLQIKQKVNVSIYLIHLTRSRYLYLFILLCRPGMQCITYMYVCISNIYMHSEKRENFPRETRKIQLIIMTFCIAWQKVTDWLADWLLLTRGPNLPAACIIYTN